MSNSLQTQFWLHKMSEQNNFRGQHYFLKVTELVSCVVSLCTQPLTVMAFCVCIFSTAKSLLKLTVKWKYFSVNNYFKHVWVSEFSFRIIVSGSPNLYSKKFSCLLIFIDTNMRKHVYFFISSFWILLLQILSKTEQYKMVGFKENHLLLA